MAVVAWLTGTLITQSLRTLALRRSDMGASRGFFATAATGTIAVATLVIIATYVVLDNVGPRFGP